MLKIRKILFPTDFSDCSEHAFAQASHLAEKYSAELHVLNVAVPYVVDPDNPMSYLEDMRFEVQLDTQALKQPYADHVGSPLIHVQKHNTSEAKAILDYTNEENIDLIVMGTHGRGGLDRLLLGSVTEKVIRLSPCPVLTVRPACDTEAHWPIRRILVPFDFSSYARRALRYAIELATNYEAHIDVLHVVTEVVLPGIYGVDTVSVSSPEVLMRVEEALHEEMQSYPGSTVTFDAHVLVGQPTFDIASYADLQKSDLIVIATHGRTGLSRLFMGSVAENVVRHASCPVFTLKSFGKSLVPEEEIEVASAAPLS